MIKGKSLRLLRGLKCFESNVFGVAPLLMVLAAIMASVLRVGIPLLSASSSILLERIESFFV
jgi:hypothetical protein